jgi:hypothetical protein
MPKAPICHQLPEKLLLAYSKNQVVAIMAKNVDKITIFLSRGADGNLYLPRGNMWVGECENDAVSRLIQEQTHVTPDGTNPVGTFQYGEGSIFAFEIISYRGELTQEKIGEQLFFSVTEIQSLQKEINGVDFQIIGYYWNHYDPGVFVFDRLMPWFEPRKNPWPKKRKRA